jgi:hypothetical protein
MEPVEAAVKFNMLNPWFITSAAVFVLLIVYFLVKFFSVFFDFVQAKGCLTIGLIALVGLPGIVVLSFITGNTILSAILILFAVIGVITGYIARDSEEEVGKFGNFIMIVSIITLIIALFLAKFA